MSSPRRTCILSLNRIRRLFPRIQPALQNHVARHHPINAFRSRTAGWSSSPALKTSASASLFVSLTGLLIWIAESNSPSNEASQFGYCKVLQENTPETSNNITDLGSRPPPSNTTFTYTRLSEDEKTRLMILEPGEPDGELRCHLKHIHALKDHEYEALSYVWGGTSRMHVIECSGMKIQITAILKPLCSSFDLPTDPKYSGLTRSAYKSIDTEQNTSET